MKRATCDRAWQVEAARDGRLDAHACAALEPHLNSCTTCRHERRRLDELALGLFAIGQDVDALALRRLRQRTLEAANAIVTQSAHPRRWRHAPAWALAACASFALAFAVIGMSRTPPAGVRSAAVVVVPDQDAKWQRFVERDVERIDLSAGTLLFRVARKPSDPRLVVRVPDGVIEDLGTTFSVSVQDGETREISVLEGQVLFHRPGTAALHLVAGSTWTPASEPVRTGVTATTGPGEPSPLEPQASLAPTPTARDHGPGAHRAVTHPEKQSRASDTAEDAAYLHIVALLREGRSAEARLAALAYLKAYPSGFRRIEVEKVARIQAASEDDALPIE